MGNLCVSCFRTEVLMGNLCVFPVLGWKCSWEICVHVFHLRMEVLMGNPCACFLSLDRNAHSNSVHVFAMNTSDPDS